MVETLDSEKLAKKLDDAWATKAVEDALGRLKVLVQVCRAGALHCKRRDIPRRSSAGA